MRFIVTICVAAGLLIGVALLHHSRPQGQHTNRLAKESSPYLLQHAHNPVDWYPWGEEAFAKAKAEGKPVFLSVGYAACHWCHVMERESFESEEIAKILNDGFVSIKVDREERPDVDDLYMNAVQMITGRGGWPMSVFLTPDGKPFHGGTYYPPGDFKELLKQVIEIWKTRKPDVLNSADRLGRMLQTNAANAPRTSNLKPAEMLKLSLQSLGESYDPVNGGFSTAPKFPPHNSLALLLWQTRNINAVNAVGRTSQGKNTRMWLNTLNAMAMGGIRDHLGGGFHRYSTDAKWLVPHFEKMLYDNALLARAYSEAGQDLGDDLYEEVAGETIGWAMREMRGPEGGFYSSLDADSEGVEGKYYLWTRKEIIDLLGPVEGAAFCSAYDIKESGNYREQATGGLNGSNILHLPRGVPQVPARKLAEMKGKLLQARNRRVRPSLDDKRLAGWNGLMLGTLAIAGRRDASARQAAEQTADFILTKMRMPGKLLRSWRPGSSNTTTAFLEDYAYVIEGLLNLYDVRNGLRSERAQYLVDKARELADEMIARFGDPAGGFFDTPADHEKLLVRGKNPYDGALPSPNAVAARDLFRLAKFDGKYFRVADSAVRALSGYAERNPAAAQMLILAAFDQDGRSQPSERKPPPNRAVSGPVTVTATAKDVVAGGSTEVVVTITVKPGWHINSDRPLAKNLTATRIRVESPEHGFEAGTPHYPKAQRIRLGFSKEELAVFTGTVIIVTPYRIARDVAAGALHVPVHVRLQACNDRECLAPVTLTVAARIQVAGHK